MLTSVPSTLTVTNLENSPLPEIVIASSVFCVHEPFAPKIILYSVSSLSSSPAAFFSKTAFTETSFAGIVNVLSLMYTPPLTTCHSLNWYPSFAVAVSVIFVPKAADVTFARAVPFPSVVTVTVYVVTGASVTVRVASLLVTEPLRLVTTHLHL